MEIKIFIIEGGDIVLLDGFIMALLKFSIDQPPHMDKNIQKESTGSNLMQTLEISNFRQGLAKINEKGRAYIYKEGNTFDYDGSDSCIIGGNEKPCQRYAVEYSYKSSMPTTVVECITMTDVPQTHYVGDEPKEKRTTVYKWNMILTLRAGRHIESQWSNIVNGRPLHMTSVCSNNGKEIMRWQMNLIPTMLR